MEVGKWNGKEIVKIWREKIKMNDILPPILERVLEKIQILGDVAVP